MVILGISAFYHDSAAAIIENGEILAAAQEERFTRIKHDPAFPKNAVSYCLKQWGGKLNELDAIVFYDKPLLKFERLLETYYGFAPRGILSFLSAIPVWLKEKMFLKKIIRDELSSIESFNRKKIPLLFPEHHLSHAASAFYPSSFEKAAILTIDGVGEWATASICKGEGNSITAMKELHFPHSLGLLYSAFTYFTGFRVNSGEYKLMGLAPYGNPDSETVQTYVSIIKEKLVEIKEDGSIWLDQTYFTYATELRMVNDDKWNELFKFPRRNPESPIMQHHCDLALAIQLVTEEIVLKMALEAKRITGCDFVCLAGGVALNCVANGKLHAENIFRDIFIQPASGDAGGAVGAALAAYYIYFKQERKLPTDKLDGMKGSFLGPEFSNLDIEYTAKKYKAHITRCNNFDELSDRAAELLAQGNVIGWFQGRMEFGPRALGARSIIGDPRNPEMQKKLNLKIKFRESFRPFAPSVLSEDVHMYFDMKDKSPYMLLVKNVLKHRRLPEPEGYHGMQLSEKLYHQRSDLPSVTHIDYSARIQTVHKETNEKYWKLIQSFKKITGIGVIVNTSFNVRGEPIVCTPEDAYKCLMRTEMDYLIINNFIFEKKLQPEWKELREWKNDYVLD